MATLNEAVTIKIMADASHFNKGLYKITKGAADAVKKIGTGFQNLGKQLMKVGTIITAAIGGAIAYSVKKFAEFETAFASLTGLFKESKAELKGYEDSILSLSDKMGIDATETTKAYYQAISAGFRSVEDAAGVTQAAAKASIAGQTEMAVSTQAITRVLNAFGKSGEDAEHVFDLLFQTVNYGVTEFKLLAPQIGKVAATAAAAKMSMEEMFSAIAVVTKALPTEEAIVATNQLLLSFIKPSDMAKAAAEELGISINAVTFAQKGLSGIMVDIISQLGITSEKLDELELMKNTANYSEAMAQMFGKASEQLAILFPNVRALRAALVLTSGGGEEFTDIMGEMTNATGAGEKAFKDQEGTLGHVFKKLKAHVGLIRIELGKIYKEDLKRFGEGLDDTLKKIKAWIKENPELVKKLTVFVGAVGIGTVALGAFSLAFGKIISLTGAIMGFFAQIIFFLLNPWQLAFAMAIGSALFLFAIFAPEKVKAIWTGFKEFLAGGVDKMRGFIGSLQEMGDEGKNAQEMLAESVKGKSPYELQKEKVAGLTDKLEELIESQKDLEQATYDALPIEEGMPGYQSTLDKFSGQWINIIDNIGDVRKELKAANEELLKMPIPVIDTNEGMKSVAETLDGIIPSLGEGGFLGFLDSIDDKLGEISTTLRSDDPITRWLDSLIGEHKSLGETNVEIFFNALKEGMEREIERLGINLQDAWKFMWENFWSKTPDWLAKGWEGFYDWWADKFSLLYDLIAEWVEKIKAKIAEIMALQPSGFKGGEEEYNPASFGWPFFQEGGYIPGGYNQPKPIIAHAGEYVINPESTAMFLPLIEALNNQGRTGAFQDLSQNVFNMGDKVTRELVRDNIIPELSRAKRAGYYGIHEGVSW